MIAPMAVGVAAADLSSSLLVVPAPNVPHKVRCRCLHLCMVFLCTGAHHLVRLARVPVVMTSRRNVKPHVSINEIACYRTERPLGCADPISVLELKKNEVDTPSVPTYEPVLEQQKQNVDLILNKT